MKPVQEKEKDIAFSQGFLETWLIGSPPQVKEHLQTISNGVTYYRDKYIEVQEDLEDALKRYADLTVLSSGYLQLIQQQKELLERAPIEEADPS
jgi:hypothetical protein